LLMVISIVAVPDADAIASTGIRPNTPACVMQPS